MLEHRRNGLYALGTCAIGGGAGWLFTHPGGVWTYIAWALIVVGVLAILAAMYRQSTQSTTTEPVDDGGQRAPAGQQASSTDPIAASTPVITDRWRLTTDGHQVPALMQLRNNSMSHPGYTEQSFLENPQPSVRIGVVMASEPLGSTPATSDIRASFLKFLHSQPVTDYLAALTVVNADALWRARDGHGRFNFGAVLDGDTALAPVAWARLLLPQTDTSYHGYDPHSAVFILHVYPRARDGSPAPAANLTTWHGRLVLGLAIASALAAFLTQDLGLASAGGQPVQAGVYLEAPHSMTELVDIEDLASLSGSSMPGWFMGWAISSPNGQEASTLAREWLVQMCDNTLYVDGYEPILAAICESGHPSPKPPSTHGRKAGRRMAMVTVITIVVGTGIAVSILLTQPGIPVHKAAFHPPQPRITMAPPQPVGVLIQGQVGFHAVNAVAFSPGGTTVATGDSEGFTYLWNLASQQRKAKLVDPGNNGDVVSVAFSHNGTMLATGDDDGDTYLWDIATRRVTVTLTDPFHAAINSVAFNGKDTILAAGDRNGFTYLWDLAARQASVDLPDPSGGGISSVAFSPDGATLATGDGDGSTYLWDLATRRVIATLPDPHGWSINSVAFSRDGTTLAVGDLNGNTYIWDVATRRVIATFTDPNSSQGGSPSSVAFSPDSAILAIGDTRGGADLWDLAAQQVVATLRDPIADDVSSVAFSPDGATLAIGDGIGRTYLWHIISPAPSHS